MTPAYSFIRFSSPQQALGDSLRRQVERSEAYCLKHNLTLVESIRDEGRSGYFGLHRKRGALGRFVKRFLNGEVPKGVFICEAFDRFTREPPRVAQQAFLSLINGDPEKGIEGLDVVTLIDEQRYSQASIDQNVGELYTSMGMMLGAYMESKNKADRIREAWEGRRTGIARSSKLPAGNFPSWIIRTPDGPVLDTDKQTVLIRIMTDLQYIGIEALARKLNAEQVPLVCERKRPRSAIWHGAMILKLARSRRLLGEQEIGHYIGRKRKLTGEIVKNAYPAAIEDESLWLAANAALDRRKTDTAMTGRNTVAFTNLFGPLARCDQCSGRMTIRHRGLRKRFLYLGCANASVGGGCTANKYHRLDKAESAILGWIKTSVIGDWAPDKAGDKIGNVTSLITRAKAEVERFAAAYERVMLRGGELAEQTQTKLEADHARKLVELRDLERQLAAMKISKPIDHQLATVRTMAGLLERLTGADLISVRGRIAQALPGLLEAIRFKPDGTIVWTTAAGIEVQHLPTGLTVIRSNERLAKDGKVGAFVV